MKQTLLITALISIAGLTQAQTTYEMPATANEGVAIPLATNVQNGINTVNEKSVSCSDAVTYTLDNHIAGSSYSSARIGGVNGWEYATQNFPDFTGQVTSVKFSGQSYMATDKPLIVSIFNWATSIAGTPLATVTVDVPTTSGDINAIFPSPANVSGGFIVVLRDAAPIGVQTDSVAVFFNSDGSALGGNYAYLVSEAQNFYSLLSDFGADVDLLVRPTIKFDHATPTISSSVSTLCLGDQVSATITPNTTLLHYSHPIYNPNYLGYITAYGDATANETTATSSHTYGATGNFTVSGYTTYIGNTSQCPSETVTTPITIDENTASFFGYYATGLSVEFTDLSSNATTHSWNFGDGGNAGSPNPVHNYAADGTYTVELTVNGPCGTDLYFLNITISSNINAGNLGIDENSDIELSIFPNPATDVVNIGYQMLEGSDFTMELISFNGAVVSKSVIPNELSGEFQFDISQLAAGMYTLKFNINDKIVVKRFVKK